MSAGIILALSRMFGGFTGESDDEPAPEDPNPVQANEERERPEADSGKGGGAVAEARHVPPKCTRRMHSALLEESGRRLLSARKEAYAEYLRRCRELGREDPLREEIWWMTSKNVYCRLLRGESAWKDQTEGVLKKDQLGPIGE